MDEVKQRPQQKDVAHTSKQRAKLDRWHYDIGSACLSGIVYDHPKLPDGQYVSTTRVLWINRKMRIAETRNTVYILLKPDQ